MGTRKYHRKLNKFRKTRSKRQRGGNQEEMDIYLFGAIDIDDPDKVENALKNGAEVNAKDEDGNTALMRASQDGYTEIVAILLKNGADVNAKDKEGRTALMEVSECDIELYELRAAYAKYVIDDKIKIIKLLINNGANIHAKDNQGNTALYWAERGNFENSCEDIVKLLEEAIETEKKIRGHKDAAMNLVQNRKKKEHEHPLRSQAFWNMPTSDTVLYNNARKEFLLPPPNKLGGKRKTRKAKKSKRKSKKSKKSKRKTRKT